MPTASLRSILLLAVLPLLTACNALNLAGDKPTVKIAGTHMTGVTASQANLVFDLAISNPYPVPLPITNLGYSLASTDKPFLTGNAPVQGTIPAGKTSTISIPVTLDYQQALNALGNAHPGTLVPYAANLMLSYNPPVGGTLSLPLWVKGSLPFPNVPAVSLADVQLENLSLDKTTAVANVNLTNNNQFPVDLASVSYNLALGGKTVATSALKNPTSLKAGQTGTIQIPLTLSPKDLGLGAIGMLGGGKKSGYQLSGTAIANVPGFGPVELPLSAGGETQLKTR